MEHRRLIICAIACLAIAAIARADATSPAGLDAFARGLDGPYRIVNGKLQTFTWDINVTGPPDNGSKDAKTSRLTLVRRGDGEFACAMSNGSSSHLTLLRTASAAAVIDHTRRRVFLGEGPTPQGDDAMQFDEFTRHLATAHGDLSAATEIIRGAADSRVMALQMIGMLKLVEKPVANGAVVLQSSEAVNGRLYTITVDPKAGCISSITWASAEGNGSLAYRLDAEARMPELPGDGYETIKVDRAELERTLVRGAVRGVEILYRLDHPRTLRDRRRKIDNGLLVIRKGQRILMLAGSPQQIGTQHGKLLSREVGRTIDSLLYTYCLHESLERGTWMLDECRKAWAAQSSHIADEYKAEMAALAKAAEVRLEDVQLVNTLPAMRRGTSFAMASQATQGGKLLHGRVLDSLTGLDMQDAATLMIIRKQGAKPLVSVGYAGLVGCLNGMNSEKIAVSAGAGDGRTIWDDEPTPFIVRQLLERCKSLDEVLAALKGGARTAQVDYVISDGKTLRAETVHTSPDNVTVTGLGEQGNGQQTPVPGCVIVANGDNLAALLA
ncbi:MAG: hypothetical protein JXL80_09215, partial [Planctomycetes bacterium]|nr:hypothetical protein [Planctomycetota bacterium]